MVVTLSLILHLEQQWSVDSVARCTWTVTAPLEFEPSGLVAETRDKPNPAGARTTDRHDPVGAWGTH